MTPPRLLATLSLLAAAAPLFAQSAPDQWNEPAGLPCFVRNGSAMVSVGDTHVYVLPGCDQYGTAPQSFYRYTVADGTWTPATGPGSLATCPLRSWYGASMTYRPNSNEIYLLPGGYSTYFLRYSISANTWTPSTGAGSLSPFPCNQHHGCALAATSTTLYALGGWVSSNQQRFFAYSPATNTWTSDGQLADVPQACFVGGTMCCPAGGEFVYAFPGQTSSFFYRYAISASNAAGQAANTWARLADLPEIAAMGATLIPGPGGSLLATSGGTNGQVGFFRFNVDASRPAGGAWSRLADLPGVVGASAALAWTGGDTVFVTRGGEVYYMRSGTVDFWRYSISNNSFGGLATLPGLVSSGGAMTGIGDGDSLFAMQGGNNTPSGYYRYSASADAWTSMAPTPTGVYGGSSLAPIGNGLLFATGHYPASNDLWRYAVADGNPALQGVDSWDSAPVIETAPSSFNGGGGVVWTGGDYLYALTGYTPIGYPSSKCYRYRIPSNSWDDDAFEDTPGPMNSGSFAWDGHDRIYVLKGEGYRDFLAYTISTNSWSTFNPADFPLPGYIGSGSAMLYPGSGREIFVLSGYADGDTTTNALWTYRLPDATSPAGSWIQKTGAPGSFQAGACLAFTGRGKYLYALGGNISRKFWRYWMDSDPPAAPASLAQSSLTGGRALAEGASTPQTGFRASGTVSDPYGDSVQLVVEVKPVGTAFDGGGLRYGTLVPSGGVSAVDLPAGTLAVGVSYHWRACTRDEREVRSTAWTSFGTNADPDGVDLRVRTNAAPLLTGLRQAWSSDGSEIVPGQPRFGETSVRMTAMLADPDLEGDQVVFEVEVRAAGEAFLGVATASSATVPGPEATAVAATGEGRYSWRCRAGDEWGAFGPWTEFGSGSAPDFELARFGSVSTSTTCLGSAAGSAAWMLPLLPVALLRRRRL